MKANTCCSNTIWCDGWPEEVVQICSGIVCGRVTETERRPTRPDDGVDCDEWIDYAVKPTDNPLQRLEAENAALRDAINALHDYVTGNDAMTTYICRNC